MTPYLLKTKLRKDNKTILLELPKGQETDDVFRIINAINKNGICVRKITGKRETWRVTDSGMRYYVKITFQNTALRKILTFLKLSKLQKELRTLKLLMEKAILVPDFIAYVKEYGTVFPQKEYIITEEIEDCRILKDFFLNVFLSLSQSEQKKLIMDFSEYIRELHDKGVFHPDPNLGNFLVNHKNGSFHFYILDLADVKIKSSASLNDKWKNLSLLNLNFFRHVSESLRYLFFKKYSAGLLKEKADIIKVIKSIESMTLNSANRTWGKRVNLCLGINSFFYTMRKGHFVTHFKRNCEGIKGFEDILFNPDTFIDGGAGTVLKDGRTVKAALVDIGDGESLFLKRYNRKGSLHTFKNIFRTSRARRVWINNYRFELRSIPIPSHVAYMEERIFRILIRSYVISRFIPDAVMLNYMFMSDKLNFPSKHKISILQEVGREVGKMHSLGCLHGDMKWSNIIVKKINGKYKCFFIDLDGSKVKKKLSLPEIIGELSRFYIEMLKYSFSFEEQEAFLNSYYKHCKFKISHNNFLDRIKKEALKKISKN